MNAQAHTQIKYLNTN